MDAYEDRYGQPNKGDAYERRYGKPAGGDAYERRYGGKVDVNDPESLEALAEQTGARTIPADSPGLGSRVVDILSRINYAIAGAVEELGSGQPSEHATPLEGKSVV